MLRSLLNQHWLRQRKQKMPFLMLTRSTSSGNRSWLSG
jgi:hypothetical protein